MCGHDGIVHGGLLATVCDEGLAVLVSATAPSHGGKQGRKRLTVFFFYNFKKKKKKKLPLFSYNDDRRSAICPTRSA
jgi:acyl-coenzyme A thioesterase PaaI-like protein